MFSYLRNSIRRKLARRFTREYQTHIDHFEVPGLGTVSYANWDNPLVKTRSITPGNVEFFKRLLKKGDFAIDIGANTGIITTYMALACGAEGTVMAFDPNPFVFKILEENAGLNKGLAHIVPHNVAITDADGEFYYHSSEASFNNGGISAESNSRHGKFGLTQKIRGVRLETFLEKEYPGMIEKLKLIKVDAEGYDKEIIKSISGLLTRYRPMVVAECFGKLSQDERFELFDLLASRGYTLTYFSDFTSEADFAPIANREDMLRWTHFDFMAVAN